MRFLLYTLSLLAALCWGCSHTPHYSEPLLRAHRLADTGHPDSALCLLDSLCATPGALEGKPEQMYADLLLVKAGDKADLPFTSDSAIIPLIEYYVKGKGDPALKPLTLYYAGRTYREIGDAPRALDYFQQALDAIPDSNNLLLRSVIHSQKSELFSEQSVYQQALNEIKSAYICSQILNDTLSMISDAIDVSNSYLSLHELDSASIFMKNALNLSSHYNNNEWMGITLGQAASLYYKLGNFYIADSLIRLSQNFHIPPRYKSSYLSTVVDIQLATGDTIAAIPNLKWLCDSGSLYSMCDAHRYLAIITANENSQEAIYHTKQAFILCDTIDARTATELLYKMNATYNYSIHERENHSMHIENLRLQRNLFISILVLLLSFLTIFWLWKRQSTQRVIIRALQDKTESITRELERRPDIISNLNDQLLNNEFVINFCNRARKNLRPNDEDWVKLYSILEDSNPQFYRAFCKSPKLSTIEQHIAIMTKLNIPVKNIAEIIYKSNSAVSLSKRRIYQKLFNVSEASSRDFKDFIDSL